MNHKIKTTIVPIEITVEGVLLKGELEFWAKDFCVKLIEPFKGSSGARLQYAVPVKYVLEKSEKPNCFEIDILEKAKDTLKFIYLNRNGVLSYE